MIRLGTLILSVLLVLVSSASVRADDAALCDALASEDALRAAVVPLQSIDGSRAMAACAAALATAPGDPALLNQYARALERDGRLADALRLYGWAASEGSLQAAAALARLQNAAAAEPAWPQADRDNVGSEMTATGNALRRYADALPADPSDPLAVLAETGTDPDEILAWVAGHTRLVPYVGSLRGAGGVLADRTGNSLDRSLALAKMLSQAGQEVRLAHTSLTPSKAEALLRAIGPTEGLPRLAAPTRKDLIALFSDPRLPLDQVASAATEAVDRRGRTERLLAERTNSLLPALLMASESGAEAADVAARAAALVVLSDHHWVQVRAGTGWRDLDPDAAVIGPLVPAETFDPKDLPDGLRHSVVLRVILELQNASGRHEEELLAHTVYPADGGVQTLTLSHTAKGLDALGQALGAPDVAERVLAGLDGVTAWTPMLLAGNSTIVDKLFTRDGKIQPANINAFAATGGDMSGLFDEVRDALSGDAPVVPPSAVPTAEWLEIEVRVPGAEPRISRRTIFDLLGPSARASGELVSMSAAGSRLRALRLVGATDILITGIVPPEAAVARTSAATTARIADNIRSFAAMPDETNIADVPTAPRVPLTLLRFAGQRLWRSGAPAIVSPNVFLMHERFGWETGTGASHQVEFDIAFNDVAGVPFAERVRQGLADTILENAMSGDPQSGNVAALHSLDLAAGRPWKRISTGDLDQLDFSPDARVRIEADLKAGYIVVARGGPGSVGQGEGWWRIDPRTGTTLGMMSSGGGADLAEYGFLALEGATTGACVVGLGLAVVAVVDGSAGNVRRGVALCLMAAGAGAVGTGIGMVVATGGVVGLLIFFELNW